MSQRVHIINNRVLVISLKVGDLSMKKYVALILQLMIWSGFTLVEWLSGRDHILAKAILFSVFFYLAFLLARMIVKSNRTTIFITVASLSAYAGIHLLLNTLYRSALFY